MTQALIDWSKLVKVWPCYEMMGISPVNLDHIQEYLRSPLLIVGGGGGLNIEYLRAKGMDVTGVDNNPEMIRYAQQSRGIEIEFCEKRPLPFDDGSFASVLVATGVVNKITLYEPWLRRLLQEVRRVLKTNGIVSVGCFSSEATLDYAFRALKLAREPANHGFFVDAQSLEQVAERFVSSRRFDPCLVEHVFTNCHEFLDAHRRLIKNVHESLGADLATTSSYIEDALGFEYHDLEALDRKYLQKMLREDFQFIGEMALPPGDVSAVLARVSN